MSAITVERVGRRSYLTGNTYPVKDAIRNAGGHWDAERKAWWLGDDVKARSIAQQSAGAATTSSNSSGAEAPKREAPGLEATVAGRAEYKGKTFYVAGRVIRGRTHWDDQVGEVTSRDGSSVLLYFRDGSSSFWAKTADVRVVKSYRKPTTIKSLRDFAERAKEARAQGNDDGIPNGATYECEECGERVTRGQGSCWETGCAH